MPVSWESYLQEVMPDVHGCPIQVAENAIRNAAIEFCNQSRVWREVLSPVLTLVDGTEDYVLTPPTDAEIMGAHKVELFDPDNNGEPDYMPLPSLPQNQLDQYRKMTQTDKPRFWFGVTPDTIRFYPIPDDGGYTAEVSVTLKPTRTSTEGPDFLFNDWLDAIAHGAKARLLGMTGRDWANPAAVPYHRKQFINNGWVEARIRDAKGNAVSTSFVVPRGTFGFGVYRGGRHRRY